MIQQAYTRTDLAKQEAMIDEWKRQNGWNDNQPAPTAKTPEKGNAFLFASTEAEKQASEKRRADYKAQREAEYKDLNKNLDKLKRKITRPPSEKTINARQAKQAEYLVKYNAQKAGNPDPIYYYSIFQGKIKQQKRKNPLPDLSNYQPFTGKYGKLKGSSLNKQIINLLIKYDYIDVEAVINEHNLNRTMFLSAAKQLERADILRMIRKGIKVVYLEDVK